MYHRESSGAYYLSSARMSSGNRDMGSGRGSGRGSDKQDMTYQDRKDQIIAISQINDGIASEQSLNFSISDNSKIQARSNNRSAIKDGKSPTSNASATLLK